MQSNAQEAKVALAAIRDKTLVELSEHFDVHANHITQWKQQLLDRAAEAFEGAGPSAPPLDVKVLHAKIGELTLENDFLESAQQGRPAERKTMIDPAHDLPVTKQAAVLGISRSSVYYLPRSQRA